MLLVLVSCGCGASATITKDELQTQSDAVHSAAAEGALLASDVARGRSTEPFARIHSGVLEDQAQAAADALDKPAQRSLEAERRTTERRAVQVADALGRLHDDPTDRALAARVRVELRRLAG